MQIEFVRPDLLYVLLLIPAWILLVWPRVGRNVFYTRGDSALHRSRRSISSALILVAPRALRAAAIMSLIIALAGPESIETDGEVVTEGGGIGLVVDLSSSMLAEDMGDQSSRISVARDAAVRFARRRPYDELSLVAFGKESLTRVPPTTDPELIAQGVETLEIQLVRDGTDIAGAVLTSVAQLLESDREPRVVVLLTDGAHNGVVMPPLFAARAASAVDVRIHSISVLSPDGEISPFSTGLRQRFNEERETVLQGLADITGGEYFQATNPAALDSIYQEIDRLEAPVLRMNPSETRQPQRTWFFLLTLTLLGLELLLRGSRWGLVP